MAARMYSSGVITKLSYHAASGRLEMGLNDQCVARLPCRRSSHAEALIQSRRVSGGEAAVPNTDRPARADAGGLQRPSGIRRFSPACMRVNVAIWDREEEEINESRTDLATKIWAHAILVEFRSRFLISAATPNEAIRRDSNCRVISANYRGRSLIEISLLTPPALHQRSIASASKR